MSNNQPVVQAEKVGQLAVQRLVRHGRAGGAGDGAGAAAFAHRAQAPPGRSTCRTTQDNGPLVRVGHCNVELLQNLENKRNRSLFKWKENI